MVQTIEAIRESPTHIRPAIPFRYEKGSKVYILVVHESNPEYQFTAEECSVSELQQLNNLTSSKALLQKMKQL